MMRFRPAPRLAQASKGVLRCALLLALATPASAQIKCWTNRDGVRECGNAIPPEYAQQEHERLNTQGVTVDHVGAAVTAEEVEAKRQAELAREMAAREAAQKRARDRVLLDTYTSVTDLELARDGQISHIESQIRITEDRIEKLRSNLDERISRAARFERQGKEPPVGLTREIDGLNAQIRESEKFIEVKEKERSEVRSQFAKDIARYRELHREGEGSPG